MRFRQTLFFGVFLLGVGMPAVGFAADAPYELVMKSGKPIAIIGLSEIPDRKTSSDCQNRLGRFVVSDIAYDGLSEIVQGVRVKPLGAKKDAGEVLIRIDSDRLPNVDRSWLPALVDRGSQLLIAYQICGNGGFMYARDVYRLDRLDW